MDSSPLRTSINVFSVRNNCIVNHFDNSTLNTNRTGTKETLKQNLVTEYQQNIANLIEVEEFEDVTEHVQKISKQYENHKTQLVADYWEKRIEHANGILKEIPTPINLKQLGSMSLNQVKSVRKNIENMVSMVLLGYKKAIPITEQQYLTFVTLTLPSKQIHSDKAIRKLQTRFIENLQKTYKVVHYVWKAETQQNGNYHSHLVIDRYIDKDKVRELWNFQLERLGYISRYAEKRKKEGFVYKPYYIKKGIKVMSKKTKQEQYKTFLRQQSEGFTNPNTTDIHSLKGINNAVSYMLKYMTKLEPTKRPIIGAVWGASNLTKKLTYPRFYESEVAYDGIMSLINSKRLRCVLKDDFFSVHCGEIFRIIRTDYRPIWFEIKKHYKRLREYTKETYQKFESDYKELKEKLQTKIIQPVKKEVKKTKEVIQNELFYVDIYGNYQPVK